MLIKKIITPLFNHLTAGSTIKSLQSKIVDINLKNLYPIPDYIKEFSNNKDDINIVINEYKKLASLHNLEFIALKLSSLNFDPSHINQVVKTLLDNNKQILIDAENVKNQPIINDITNELITTHNKSYVQIYKTYQMYRIDQSKMLLDDLKKYPRLGIKLVRGAYQNEDKNTTLLFKIKKETDEAYSNALDVIFDKKNSKHKSFICTHNSNDINKMIDLYNKNSDLYSYNIYHASLYGFIERDTKKIIDSGMKTFKYLPYGEIEDAVPYLMRRIYENPKVLYFYFR
jgi:hypothetical protein